jgi:membrane-associated phospholipid phosphatase
MDGFGLKGTHNWQQQSILFGRAQLIMLGLIIPLKKLTQIVRPDSSAFNSFPSGHTAQAFMAATFFHKEFGKKYPWASVGMFTLAGSIGVFRLLNNRHWISDVLAGAGIGILSVELSYLLHKNKIRFKRGIPDALIPSYSRDGIGCTAIFRL